MRWDEREKRLLAELKEKGKTTKQIRRALKKEFGNERSNSSIYTMVTKFNQGTLFGKDSQAVEESVQTTEESIIYDASDFQDEIARYDQKNILNALRKRQGFVYGLMEDQAKSIRENDFVSQYGGLTFAEMMELEPGKRRDISKALETSNKGSDIKNIGLLAIPGFGESREDLSLVLPLYLVDAKGESKGTLSSALNDAVMGVMLKEMGFKPTGNLTDRFRELLMYNFQGPGCDYREASERITRVVKAEYSPIQGVSIFEDQPSFYHLLEDD